MLSAMSLHWVGLWRTTASPARFLGLSGFLGLLGCFGLVGCGEDKDSGNDDTESTNDDGVGSESTASIPSDCTPDYECKPVAPDTGDFYADCAARVNQFRACVCLPPLERNRDAESCLDQQAEYDSDNGAHAGFIGGICSPNGSAQNECPGWRDARQVVDGCLQMMFDEGPPPSKQCEGQCYQEHGHHINMTGNYGKVACGLYEANGEVWSVHNFF